MDFGGHPYTFDHLAEYTDTAARLGFSGLSVNDHMVFSVPWLDGPIALAAMIGHSGGNGCGGGGLPVVRGPVQLAKSLAAIDRLTDGRLGIITVGPGSSEKDYTCVGLDFEERWARLDESIGALRALWSSDGSPFVGRFYSTEGVSLDPHPNRPDGPPIWTGSWRCGSQLRRTARLADGWLASAYNTTPTAFAEAWARLRNMLPAHGKEFRCVPQCAGDHVVPHHRQPGRGRPGHAGTAGATIHRPEEMLRARLPVGPAESFAEKLWDFARAGVQRVFVWPVVDEAHQLERFWEKVRPAIIAG